MSHPCQNLILSDFSNGVPVKEKATAIIPFMVLPGALCLYRSVVITQKTAVQ